MRRTRFVIPGVLSLWLLAAACQPSAPAMVDGSPRRGAESPALRTGMRGHDVHGAAMRDAVARGDLDRAKREARLIADIRIEGDLDPVLRDQIDSMHSAAARLADAPDLAEASRRLAALGLTCGDCHAARGGPRPMVAPLPEEGPGIAPQMKRHQWAVARLWDGLMVPSDPAWKVGARVLADAPLEPQAFTPGKPPSPAIGTLASSVHELARKAGETEARQDRAAIFGEVMATCAACHVRLGGGPP